MISTPMVNPAHVTDPEKKLDVAEPSTSNSSRVYQAMRWTTRIVVVLILFTALDLLLFSLYFKMPIFNKIDIYLEPRAETSPNSDASVTVQGSITKSSLTTQVNSPGAVCDYYYRASSSAEFKFGGHLEFVLPPETNPIDEFDIRGDMQQVNCITLRKIYGDVSGKVKVISEVKLKCKIDVEATLYKYLTMQKRIAYDTVVPLDDIRRSLLPNKSPS
jgi:hypothetical protein